MSSRSYFFIWIRQARVAFIILTIALAIAALPGYAEVAKASATAENIDAGGDGKSDDTAALQKAVDSGRGDILLPRGVYRITKPIVVELDKVGVTSIRSSGTATIVMAGPGPALKFVGTHGGSADPGTVKPNVYEKQRSPIVEGLEIVGEHPQSLGIEAVKTFGLIVDKVTVRETLHAVRLTERNRNVIVSNCHFYNNRGAGLFLDQCDLHQINVVGCHISYNRGGGVVVHGGGIRNLHIGTCDIEANVVNVFIDSEASPQGGTAEVAIVGCTLQHSGGPDSANIRFIGAAVNDKDGKPGPRAWGNLTIGNNVISDTECNIDIKKAVDVSIVGNTIWQGYKYNLRVTDSENVVVGPNIFGRNPRYRSEETCDNGLLLENCDNLTLTGLQIQNTRRTPAGLVMQNCRWANIANCTILGCENLGVLLKDVRNSRVSGCLIDPPNAVKVEGGQPQQQGSELLLQ